MIILQFPVNNLVHSSHLRKCRDVSWASGFCVVWGFFEPVLAVISTRWTPWDVKLFFALLWLNFIWMKQDFSCNLQGFKSALQDPTSFLTMRPCWKDNTTALFLVSDRNCALQACSSFPLRRSCPRTASLSPLRCDPKLQQELSPIHGPGSVQTPPQTPQQQAGSAQWLCNCHELCLSQEQSRGRAGWGRSGERGKDGATQSYPRVQVQQRHSSGPLFDI